MKNLSNLGFIVLLLVVLGCSCPKLNELTREKGSATPSAPSNANSTSTPPKTASKSDLTMSQYEQIKNDMKKSEVESILGGKGTEVSSSTGGGMTFLVYKWEGENYKTIIVTFKNDRVIAKSQVNLK